MKGGKIKRGKKTYALLNVSTAEIRVPRTTDRDPTVTKLVKEYEKYLVELADVNYVCHISKYCTRQRDLVHRITFLIGVVARALITLWFMFKVGF